MLKIKNQVNTQTQNQGYQDQGLTTKTSPGPWHVVGNSKKVKGLLHNHIVPRLVLLFISKGLALKT